MLKEQDIWKLMARCIFGEATPEEKESLQAHLKENPSLQQQFELLANTLNSRRADENDNESATAFDIIKKANAQVEKPVYRLSVKKYLPLAAASIILIVAAAWFFLLRNGPATTDASPENQKPAYTAQNGVRKQVELPDGTKVWLNSGSDLYFINDFTGASREVKLEGEAFFDVVKNAARPFIVHAGDIDVKVLGTAFNVKAYPADGNVETTLYRGLVNITKANDKTFQPIMLYPNQKITVPRHRIADEGDKIVTTSSASTIKKSIAIQQIDSTRVEPLRIETAWMYNRLEFKGDSFAELALKMERWYNVKISFTDESVKQLNFTGSFEKENVEQALLALSVANSFNYKINANEIIISSGR